MCKTRLVNPKDVIYQFNTLWTSEDGNYTFALPDGDIDITMHKGLTKNDFISIRQGEELLDKLFLNMKEKRDLHSVQTAVIALDAIYHTQMKDPLFTARNIFAMIDSILQCIEKAKNTEEKGIAVDKIVRINNDDVNLYSFATKFCSFCNPEEYPIIDSYSSTLIYRYLKDLNEEIYKSMMGKYDYYISQYDVFSEKYELKNMDDLTYKSIDRFLWTYGKLLSNMGRMSFEGVSYICDNE